jgi:hypothetical protein
MLTPRVLDTFCCVLFLQVLCKMKKLLGGVKRAFSSGPSHRGSSSCSNNYRSQDTPQSSSFVPSPKSVGKSSLYAFSLIFLMTLNGPSALGINLDYLKSENRSFLRCNQTKSPGSKSNCFLHLSPLILYLALMHDFMHFQHQLRTLFSIKI